MDSPEVPPATEPEEPPAKPDTTFGVLCHLMSLVQFVGIPLGNVIGPLVVWLVKRNDDPFADACGKEAVNFQISMTIYMAISAILVLLFIGFFLLIAVVIANIVYTIIAAVKASEGGIYTYPFTIRFIK